MGTTLSRIWYVGPGFKINYSHGRQSCVVRKDGGLSYRCCRSCDLYSRARLGRQMLSPQWPWIVPGFRVRARWCALVRARCAGAGVCACARARARSRARVALVRALVRVPACVRSCSRFVVACVCVCACACAWLCGSECAPAAGTSHLGWVMSTLANGHVIHVYGRAAVPSATHITCFAA